MDGNDQLTETGENEPGLVEREPLTTSHGPVLDIEEAFNLGILSEDTGGTCYERFDDNAKECKKCFESDRCAKATLNKFNESLITAEEAAGNVPTEKKQYLPEAFIPFDDMVRNLDHGIVRFTRETQVLYMFRGKKVLSVVQPMDDHVITVMLHECRLKDLEDPQGMLWDGESRSPEKPFMFVESTQQKAAIKIVGQLHKKIKINLGLFDKDKYKNVRQQIKTNTVQRSKILAAARERKRATKDKAGSGDKDNRSQEAGKDVQGKTRRKSTIRSSRTKS